MIFRLKRIDPAGPVSRWILFFLIFVLSASLIAQEKLPDVKVSVQARNRTISQILEEITLQTGYYFTYDASLIPVKEKLDFNVKNLEISSALDSLLKSDELDYMLIDKNIVIYRENKIKPRSDEFTPEHTVVKGVIVSDKSDKPLPYATIALLGTNLGAISNNDGEFSFKLPVSISDPILVISYIGYKNKYFPISYPVKEPLVIEMEQDLVSLQEVIIRYQDPVSIIKMTLEKIPDNYLNDYSKMTAFYRESVKRNDHCMILSEAVLNIAKGPYDNPLIPDRVKIFKGRKIVDVSEEDTILLKIKSGIYTSLDLDIIKNPPDFLSDNFNDLYTYDFADIISYGNNLVYVINFSPRSNIEQTLFKGTLYIDVEDLALVSADFRYDPEKIQREQGLFVVSKSRSIKIRPISAQYHVDYRTSNGQYHISQVRAEVDMKIRKKRKWISSKYNIRIEMAITNVNPGERLKIDFGERVRPNTVLSDEAFEYDPKFWGIYNIIEPEASLEEALMRIQKSMLEYLQPTDVQ